LAAVTVRELLDAGMHYGHHVSRWNPKMGRYIFGKRNSIHIINLRETMRGMITARKFVAHVVASGKIVVFVGTKRQARSAVREEAIRCGMPFVVERWLGGTLTNFRTIRSRLQRLEELEGIVSSDAIDQYSKKEGSRMKRELSKILRNLDGIRKMDKIPGAVIVVDPRREKIAIAEAQRLNLPTICLADTDCDPDMADVLIPGNDDAMRAVQLVIGSLAGAVLEGKELRKARAIAESAAAAKAAEATATPKPSVPKPVVSQPAPAVEAASSEVSSSETKPEEVAKTTDTENQKS